MYLQVFLLGKTWMRLTANKYPQIRLKFTKGYLLLIEYLSSTLQYHLGSQIQKVMWDSRFHTELTEEIAYVASGEEIPKE